MLINRRNGLMASGRLPYKKRLAYAHIGNGQYFVTNWTVNQSPSAFDTFAANIRVTALTGSYDWYFGGWNNSAGYGTFFRRQAATDSLNSGTYFKTLLGSASNPQANWYKSPITTDFVDMGFDLEGAFFGTANMTWANDRYTYTMPFSVGGMLVDSAASYTGSEFDLASLKVYTLGTTLAHSVFPVVDLNDVVCFYDEVTRQFFYNQGTGSFVAGPEIVPVEYIQSTGTQYIDTKIDANWTGLRVELDMLLYAHTDNEVDFFGGNNYNQTNFNYAGGFNNLGSFVLQTSANYVKYGAQDVERHLHIYDNTENRAYLDSTYSSWTNWRTSTGTFKIFQRVVNGIVNNPSHNNMYGSKFYKNGVLVRDYQPVRVGSGSTWEGAMLDKVSGAVYRNAGTGAFLYGNDI